MDASAVTCIHNILTAIIVILFCLICSLVNKCCAGPKFAEDGADGDSFPVNYKEVEYVGQVTPSNNFIIQNGDKTLKVPLYTFLANSAMNQSQSSKTENTEPSVELGCCNLLNELEIRNCEPIHKISPSVYGKAGTICTTDSTESSEDSDSDESCNVDCLGKKKESIVRCKSTPQRSSSKESKCPLRSISTPISNCLETPPPPYETKESKTSCRSGSIKKYSFICSKLSHEEPYEQNLSPKQDSINQIGKIICTDDTCPTLNFDSVMVQLSSQKINSSNPLEPGPFKTSNITTCGICGVFAKEISKPRIPRKSIIAFNEKKGEYEVFDEDDIVSMDDFGVCKDDEYCPKNKRSQSVGNARLSNNRRNQSSVKDKNSSQKMYSSGNIYDEEIKRLYKKYGPICNSVTKDICKQSNTEFKKVSFDKNDKSPKSGINKTGMKSDVCGKNSLKKMDKVLYDNELKNIASSKSSCQSCLKRKKKKKKCTPSKIPKRIVKSREYNPCIKKYDCMKGDIKDKDYKELLDEILDILVESKLEKDDECTLNSCSPCSSIKLQDSCSKKITCPGCEEMQSSEQCTVIYKDPEFEHTLQNIPSDSSNYESEESSCTLDNIGFQKWQNVSDRKKWQRNISCCSSISRNSYSSKKGSIPDRYSPSTSDKSEKSRRKGLVIAIKYKGKPKKQDKSETSKSSLTENFKKTDNEECDECNDIDISNCSARGLGAKSCTVSSHQKSQDKMSLSGSGKSTCYVCCNLDKQKIKEQKSSCQSDDETLSLQKKPYSKRKKSKDKFCLDNSSPLRDSTRTSRKIKRPYEYTSNEIPKKKLQYNFNNEDSRRKSKSKVGPALNGDILRNILNTTKNENLRKRLNGTIEDTGPIKKMKINFKEKDVNARKGEKYNIRLKSGSCKDNCKSKVVNVSTGITITTQCDTSIEQLSDQKNMSSHCKPLLKIRIKKDGINSDTQFPKAICIPSKNTPTDESCDEGAKEYLETLRRQNYSPAPRTDSTTDVKDIINKYHINLTESLISCCGRNAKQISAITCQDNNLLEEESNQEQLSPYKCLSPTNLSSNNDSNPECPILNKRHYCYPLCPHYETYVRIYEELNRPNELMKRNFYVQGTNYSGCVSRRREQASTSVDGAFCSQPLLHKPVISHHMQHTR